MTFILFPPGVFTLSEDKYFRRNVSRFFLPTAILYEEHGYSAAILLLVIYCLFQAVGSHTDGTKVEPDFRKQVRLF